MFKKMGGEMEVIDKNNFYWFLVDGYIHFDDGVVSTNIDELSDDEKSAMNQQMKELGWL